MGWFCLNRNFNFGGESSVKSGNSGVSPDTQEISHPETPGINPDIPGFAGF